ncbi:hypothetical protein MD484_g6004, partial [Candolleomyces efflorescens]
MSRSSMRKPLKTTSARMGSGSRIPFRGRLLRRSDIRELLAKEQKTGPKQAKRSLVKPSGSIDSLRSHQIQSDEEIADVDEEENDDKNVTLHDSDGGNIVVLSSDEADTRKNQRRGRKQIMGEVIEISESDEDAGAKSIQPGDSAYRGSGKPKSRVHTVQEQREMSPPLTRRRAKLYGGDLLPPSVISSPPPDRTRSSSNKRPADSSSSARPSKKQKTWDKEFKLRFTRLPKLPAKRKDPSPRSPSPLSSTDPDDVPEFNDAMRKWMGEKVRDVHPDDENRSTEDKSLGIGLLIFFVADDEPSVEEDEDEWGGCDVGSDVLVIDNELSSDAQRGAQRVNPRTPSPTAPLRSSKDKGKSKAPLSPAPHDDGVIASDNDELLSEYERNMRTAMRNSLGHGNLDEPGPSSAAHLDGSLTAPTPPAAPVETPSTPAGPVVKSGGDTAVKTPSTPVRVSVNNKKDSVRKPSAALPKVPVAPSTPQTPTKPAVSTSQPPTPNNSSIKHHCLSLPDCDEVTDPDVQDVLLADDYAKCPPLRAGILLPLKESVPMGCPALSAWEQNCDGLNMESAFNAVRFVEGSNQPFINPCRASPLAVDCKETIKGKRFVLLRSGRPLVSVVSGSVEWSQLTHLGDNPVKVKFIRVRLHGQELERFMAWTTMVFPSHLRIYTHLWQNAFQFSTKSAPWEKKASPVKPRMQGLYMKPKVMGAGSGATTGGADYTGTDGFALSHLADVPVFDARDMGAIDFNVELPDLDAHYPRFFGEVPLGSLVVVGHTMTLYLSGSGENEGKWCLSMNVLWVILLATPNAAAVEAGKAQVDD